jgi:hypothetical protein
MKKILLLIVIFINFGCNKFLTDYSQDLVVVKTVSDLDELILGSAYLPSKELTSFTNARDVCPWLNFLDDDINSVAGTSTAFRGGWDPWIYPYIFGYTTWQQDVSRKYDKTNGTSDDLTWRFIYNRINIVNIILEELKNVNTSTDTEKLSAIRIEGEASFLRAQFYFLLVNLYGDAYVPSTASEKLGVPLKLTEYVEHQGNKTVQFQRATLDAIYNQIVLDLEKSIDCFERSPQTKMLYRASKSSSLLLLSRVYLYMQNWTKAEQTASEFINTNSPLTNLNTLKEGQAVITKDNREVIFSQGHLNLQNVLTGYSDDFCVSNDLYNLFDDDDSRKSRYFQKHPITDSIELNGKYIRGIHRSYVSDLFMLRNAEGYLNLAEAAAMNGNISIANKALNDLRIYRIANYTRTDYNSEDIFEQIRDERRKELCFEGHRWFDLRRYSVNQTHVYSKDIIRIFHVFNQNSQKLIQTEIYRLPANDKSYTFSIPKAVIEFEPGLINNERENRPYEGLIIPN